MGEELKNIRLLGFSEQPFTMDENGLVHGKHEEYFNELGKRFKMVGMESVRLSRPQLALSLLRSGGLMSHSPRIEATLSVNAFKLRTQMAEERLKQWDGKYDLILQLHTLLQPGTNFKNRNYLLATDNTYAMSLKYWPDWLPRVSDKQHEKWMELERETYFNARYIFGWSDFVRRSMLEDYNIPEEKVLVIGVGANFYDEVYIPAQYDSKTALFVGNDFERKGGYILLKAWEKVIQAIPDAKLRIVGAKQRLGTKVVVEESELPKGVEWIGRVGDRNYLRQLFNESAIFIMPSLFEPYGLVYKEAMGVGVACIAPNACAMPEFIKDGETGILVDPRNVDEIAEKLIHVLNNPDYAARLGKASHREITEKHQWADLIEEKVKYIVDAASN